MTAMPLPIQATTTIDVMEDVRAELKKRGIELPRAWANDRALLHLIHQTDEETCKSVGCHGREVLDMIRASQRARAWVRVW